MTDNLEERVRQELAPDLEVVRLIGRGSVASVFLAREPALRRLVAVKVLRPDVASDEVTRRRFEREAQTAARLNHPNVTDIYRVGRLRSGVPYIVMEYIAGHNLADVLQARGRLTVEEVRRVVAGVADALSAAHANGIIHRDVRPANVIREDRTDRYVLTDFGIAALLESGGEVTTQLTTVGHRIGHPRYMSPEQLNGEPLTVQADLFSLGVMGYELLTGEGPFGPAPNLGVAITQQLRGEPRRLSSLLPGVDPVLARVLEHCLARNPDHRPRAADILLELAGMAPGETKPATEPEPTNAFSAFIAELKRRRVYKVGALYVVALAGGLEMLDQIGSAIERKLLPPPEVVVIALIGLPVTLSLAWTFDIRDGRIRRAAADPAYEISTVRRLLPWVGLAISGIIAVLIGLKFL